MTKGERLFQNDKGGEAPSRESRSKGLPQDYKRFIKTGD
jgi:hypothetical protein